MWAVSKRSETPRPHLGEAIFLDKPPGPLSSVGVVRRRRSTAHERPAPPGPIQHPFGLQAQTSVTELCQITGTLKPGEYQNGHARNEPHRHGGGNYKQPIFLR